MKTATRELILRALAEPCTRHELAAEVRVNVRTIQYHLTSLRDETPRVVRIAKWLRRSPGCPTPYYVLDPGPDAPRPRRRTDAEVAKAYRLNNPEAVLDDIHRKRAARVAPSRDPLTSAFFGPAA